MENENGFEKELDEQTAEKDGSERIVISKSFNINWDSIIYDWLKRLFSKNKE